VSTWPRANDRFTASQSFITPHRALALAILFLVSALAWLYLWQSWQSVYWLNQVQQNREKLTELQAERDQFQLEVSRAFSLQRTEEFASERLGMIHPPLQFLVLPPADSPPPTVPPQAKKP
jgi:cell division protein FtsL